LLGFVIVDDGVVADIGDSFVFLVDGGVLRVDVSKVGAVVGVDVTVPCVFVNSKVCIIGNIVELRWFVLNNRKRRIGS